MLPTEDAALVGEELSRRFGLPAWSFALTATDANRWALRLCRASPAAPVLVFSHCYHGSVDETFIVLDAGGRPRSREGNVGPPVDPSRRGSASSTTSRGSSAARPRHVAAC